MPATPDTDSCPLKHKPGTSGPAGAQKIHCHVAQRSLVSSSGTHVVIPSFRNRRPRLPDSGGPPSALLPASPLLVDSRPPCSRLQGPLPGPPSSQVLSWGVSTQAVSTQRGRRPSGPPPQALQERTDGTGAHFSHKETEPVAPALGSPVLARQLGTEDTSPGTLSIPPGRQGHVLRVVSCVSPTPPLSCVERDKLVPTLFVLWLPGGKPWIGEVKTPQQDTQRTGAGPCWAPTARESLHSGALWVWVLIPALLFT